MNRFRDLTLKEISARCTDKEIAKYIASMSPLPEGITVCKFLAIFLYSARKAQFKFNSELAKEGDKRRLSTYELADKEHKVYKDGECTHHITVYKLVVGVSVDKKDIQPVLVDA
jgi:hypothetical protein